MFLIFVNNIIFIRWERALELALQNNIYIDLVVGYRRRYLEQVKKEETLKKFIQYQDKVNKFFFFF